MMAQVGLLPLMEEKMGMVPDSLLLPLHQATENLPFLHLLPGEQGAPDSEAAARLPKVKRRQMVAPVPVEPLEEMDQQLLVEVWSQGQSFLNLDLVAPGRLRGHFHRLSS